MPSAPSGSTKSGSTLRLSPSRKLANCQAWSVARSPCQNPTFPPAVASRRLKLLWKSPWLSFAMKIPYPAWVRSEEHTSELQSHSDLVCRLLLEKKKKKMTQKKYYKSNRQKNKVHVTS